MDFGDDMGNQTLGLIERLAMDLIERHFRKSDRPSSEASEDVSSGRLDNLETPATVGLPDGFAEAGDAQAPAIAAVFDSLDEAQAAVGALTDMGITAAVARQAEDGTCEVVVDVAPSEAQGLGRELWRAAGSVRQREFEATLEAASVSAVRSGTLADSARRTATLKLGGAV